MIGAMLAVKSPADGYTMYLGGITTLVLAPMLHKNLQYDPMRDFQPVSQTTLSPLLLMTHPSLPVRSAKEFVALAKARPGQINYASSGPGGSGHLAGELFKFVTHVDLVHVPWASCARSQYQGGAVEVGSGRVRREHQDRMNT